MRSAWKNIALRFLWIIMALQILNCSEDCQDQRLYLLPRCENYNHQESIIESVEEILLGIEDAVPECEHRGAGNRSLALKEGVDCYTAPRRMVCLEPIVLKSFSEYVPREECFSMQHIPDLSPPPPKA